MALVVLGALALLDLPASATASLDVVGVVMLIAAVAQLATWLLVPGREVLAQHAHREAEQQHASVHHYAAHRAWRRRIAL